MRGPIGNIGGTPTYSGSYEFQHKLLYLRAGIFAGNELTFDDARWGESPTAQTYTNQLAAWKSLSLAIQHTRSLTFAMPYDSEIESYYQKHATLGEKISHLSILAYSNIYDNSESWNAPADQSIDIFEVTVPTIRNVMNFTIVNMFYSGATKEWF
jgi:hypothetical protein